MPINRAKIFLPALIVGLLLTVSGSASAEDILKVSLGVHFVSSAGQSSSQLLDMSKGIIGVLKSGYGCDVAMKSYPSQEAIQDAFLKNEIDAAVFLTGDVIAVEEKGASVHPWITFQIKKREKAAYCLWSKKGGAAKSISDVTGKSLIQGEFDVASLTYLRDYLYRNGVDKPLWRVFGDFTSVSSSNSAFMSLAMGKGDIFWITNDYETTLKLIAPNVASQVSYTLCGEPVYARGGLVLNNKTLSKGELKRLDDALLKVLKEFNELAKKDQSIKAVKEYLNLAKARIAPARPDEFDYEIKLFQTARKRGWIAEAEFILKQIDKAPKGSPVEIKMDFATCEKSCAVTRDKMGCVKKCME